MLNFVTALQRGTYIACKSSTTFQHWVLNGDEPKVIPQSNRKQHLTKRKHAMAKRGRPSITAEPYQAHRYVAGALAPQTHPGQQRRCQVDLARQHCVHEPAIAATFLNIIALGK